MSSKVRWHEVMQRPHGHFVVVNAIQTLNRKWYQQHSDCDGSEFNVEGLYSPHLEPGSRGVPVPFDSLGSTCLTQIAGLVAMVSLPYVPCTPIRGQSISLEQPYLHHEWLRGADWSGLVDSTWGWGTASTTPEHGHVRAFRVAVASDFGRCQGWRDRFVQAVCMRASCEG